MSHESPSRLYLKVQEELDISDHELARTYKPTFIGFGHEHVVFSVENHPDVVVKVNVGSVEASIQWYIEHGGDTDDILDDTHAMAEFDSKSEYVRHGIQLLREHFGTEHTLRSRYVRIKIPFLSALRQRFGIDNAALTLPDEIYVMGLVQERVPEFDTQGNYKSLNGFYAFEEPEMFSEGMLHALFPNDPQFMNPNPKMQFDPDTQEAVHQFVKSAIQYSNATGKILDAAGKDNVILRKVNGQWDYLLVDALFPALRANWLDRMKTNIEEYVKDPDTFDIERQTSNIINSTNYVRLINTLSESLDTEERIDCLHETVQPTEYEKVRKLILESHAVWTKRRKG